MWAVEYNSDMGAEMPSMSHAALGKKGLDSWATASSPSARAKHEKQILMYWQKSGHVTDSEREDFRAALLKQAAAAYGDNEAVTDFVTRLSALP